MKPKILICDDEEGIREALKLILEENYDLSFCSDGGKCLSTLKDGPKFNVVLLDIKMPKINGLEILKQIKSVNPQIKVIMVTGYRSVETAEEAVKAGANDYVLKPFTSKDVLGSVTRVLSRP